MIKRNLNFQPRFHPRRRGNEARLISDDAPSSPDHRLIRTLALAHAWLDEIKSGAQLKYIAARYNWSSRMVRQRIKLAYLSPRIVQVILEGRQPDDLNLTRLITSEVPLDWNEQWIEFGFESLG